MKITLTTAFVLACAAIVSADDLPRKAKTARESYPNVDVIYDSIATPRGERLRAIITKPHNAKGKLPVIFVAGWLSCDSVEAPADTKDATGLIFRGLAQSREWCLFRIDKQGVGDSEGNCAENDFESELAGYRAAFRALNNYNYIDANRIYVLGISNGGGFAPLIPESDAEQAQVRGYVSVGGWVKTWFEHMLEIERRSGGRISPNPGTLYRALDRLDRRVVIAMRRPGGRFGQPAKAADEIVRWATPVVAFQRTATADHEIAGEAVPSAVRTDPSAGSSTSNPGTLTRRVKVSSARAAANSASNPRGYPASARSSSEGRQTSAQWAIRAPLTRRSRTTRAMRRSSSYPSPSTPLPWRTPT